jgi:hypothetical protein
MVVTPNDGDNKNSIMNPERLYLSKKHFFDIMTNPICIPDA